MDQTVIRWYDWVVALLAADFMLTNVTFAVVGAPGAAWYMQIVAAITAFFLYDLWSDYCNFRKKREFTN